jgi:hypothetical protein
VVIFSQVVTAVSYFGYFQNGNKMLRYLAEYEKHVCTRTITKLISPLIQLTLSELTQNQTLLKSARYVKNTFAPRQSCSYTCACASTLAGFCQFHCSTSPTNSCPPLKSPLLMTHKVTRANCAVSMSKVLMFFRTCHQSLTSSSVPLKIAL